MIKYFLIISLTCFLLLPKNSDAIIASNKNSIHKEFLVKEIQVNVENHQVFKDLDLVYTPYIGKLLDNSILKQLESKLTNYFIDQNYLLPEITIAQQNLITGLLVINVSFKSLDQVIIAHHKENNTLLHDYVKKILSSKPTRTKYVEKYLTLIKAIPGYNITYRLNKSYKTKNNKQIVYNALILDISKSKGLIEVSANNLGSNSTGKLQESITAMAFSPFGKSDTFLLDLNKSNHFDRFNSIYLSYNAPINDSGTFVDFSTSFTKYNATLKGSSPTKSNKSNMTKASIGHHIYIDSKHHLKGSLNVVYTNSKYYTVNYYNEPTLGTSAQRWSTGATLSYSLSEKSGYSNFSASYNKGIHSLYNNYDYSEAINPYYSSTTLNFSRNQYLPKNFSIFTSMTAAWANGNSPNDFSLSLGGQSFSRGYSPGALSGNNLFAAVVELRYDSYIKNSKIFQIIQPYFFYDNGYIGNRDTDTNISKLPSLGPGIRTTFKHGINLRTEVSIPIRQSYTVSGYEYKNPPIFSFFINKTFWY